MNAEDVLEWARGALRSRWGDGVDATVATELGGSNRSIVLRIALTGEDAPAETGIVKAYVGDGDTWQNEAAGAAYLGRVGGGLTPDLLALDGARRVVVLTDLGDHQQLSDVLLGADPIAAENALLAWARDLGRLLAPTFGGRADYVRVRAELGLDKIRPPWEHRVRSACDEFADVVRARLGLTAPAGVADEIESALTLLEDAELEVVSPSDMCPDNNLLTPQGVRFLDLEFAGCSPIFLEAAYTRLPFPTCWCTFDTPPGVLNRVEEALRAPLVAAKPELGDDDRWRAGMARGYLLWTVLRVVGLLQRQREELHLDSWDRDGVSIPMWDRITMHFLGRAEQNMGADLPATVELMSEVHRRLEAEWDVRRLPVYPAFR